MLLAAGTGWCGGQSKPPAPTAAPAGTKAANNTKEAPKRAAPAVVPDAQIEAAIRARFAKSKIAADKFTVKVQGGVATIEGRTDVVQRKGTATRLARLGGATAVNNRIQVSDAARAKASKNLEEGRRRVQVKRGDPRSETARQ
jgi:hypothetical protein